MRLTIGGHLPGSPVQPALRRGSSHESTFSTASRVSRVSSTGSLADQGPGSPTGRGGGGSSSAGAALPMVPAQSFAQLDADLSVEYNMSLQVPPQAFHMRAFIGCPLEFPVTNPLCVATGCCVCCPPRCAGMPSFSRRRPRRFPTAGTFLRVHQARP